MCVCPARAFPVNVGAPTVPAAVNVCECVPRADPVKLGVDAASVPTACRCDDPAPLVTPLPVKAGTSAGHATVPAGVIEATPPAGSTLAAVIPVVLVFVGSVLSANVPLMDVSIVNPLDPPVAVGYRCVR